MSGWRDAGELPAAPALVLRAVRVGSRGPVTDVLLAEGRVAAVGPAVAEPGVPVWQQPGAVLLPGFVDAHLHATQWAVSRMRVDVAAARSPRETAELLVAAVDARPQSTPRDEWVVGRGFRDALWAEPPHRDLLEQALPGRPVAVVSHDLHSVWLSPAGLARIGRTHPTGLLREGAAMEATAAVDAERSPREIDRWVTDALEVAAARGITGVVDFEYSDNHSAWLRRLEPGAGAAERPSTRVRAAVWLPWLDAALERGLRTGDPVPGGRGLLQTGPFKVIADGALNTRTAFCHDAYPEAILPTGPGADPHGDPGPGPHPDDPDESRGLLLVSEDELVRLMTRASAGGLRPAVHAIGDAANSLVLHAFERVGCAGSIEHAQLVRPEDAQRFARPGLIASVQPQHAVADREVAERHWRGRTANAFPYASLLAVGARLVFGSDAPVAEPLPLQAVADAVVRSDDEQPPWHPEQTIPLGEALPAASAGRRGVQVGSQADLVLLAADPADVPIRDAPRIPVLATLVAGRFTHGSPG